MTTEPAERRSSTEDSWWQSALRAPEWGLAVGVVVVLGLIYVLDSSHAFFSAYSRQTVLHQVALFGVLSVGAAVVIIAGGIDLSVGAVAALSSVVSAKLLTDWLHTGSSSSAPPSVALILLAITLTLVMGVAIGLFHAFMINQLRLPPFIATLATMAGLRSLAMILSEKKSINVNFAWYRVFGSNPTWTLAIFAVVAVSA